MIRLAKFSDLDEIMLIYQDAQRFMVKNNNPNQWKKGYPYREEIEDDIKAKQLYVDIDEKGAINFVFAFIIGEDPTYKKIEGKWLNDLTYGTIHRLASNHKIRNAFGITLEYCLSKINNIRVDTHKDNVIMQHQITKNGFTFCGIISKTEDNSKRLAYQYYIDK